MTMKPLTVGELRKRLEGVDGDAIVHVPFATSNITEPAYTSALFNFSDPDEARFTLLPNPQRVGSL